jgi:uncharacterized membrane protein YfcA
LELTLSEALISIGGGFLAGVINTLAGNGSAITLTILTEMLGMPGNLANGSNRVGILMQGAASNYTFFRNRMISFSRSKWMIFWMTLGAVLGVFLAIKISNDQFRVVFKYLLVVLLLIVLIKPDQWIKKVSNVRHISPYLAIPLYLALGFYGGFIQMGMGVFFLAVTVLLIGYNIIEANAIKNLVVFIYHIVVIAIFHWQGLIDWYVGGIIGIGQMVGGFSAAHFASNYKGAEIWAYRLLIVVMVLAVLSVFEII